MAYTENPDIEVLSQEDGKQRLEDEQSWHDVVENNHRLIEKTWQQIDSFETYYEFGMTMTGRQYDSLRRLAKANYPVEINDGRFFIDRLWWNTIEKHWNVSLCEYH